MKKRISAAAVSVLGLGLLAFADQSAIENIIAKMKATRLQLWAQNNEYEDAKAKDSKELALDKVPLVLMYHDILDDYKADKARGQGAEEVGVPSGEEADPSKTGVPVHPDQAKDTMVGKVRNIDPGKTTAQARSTSAAEGKGPEEASSDVLRTDFQDQLTWLREHGYHSVTIDQFYQAMIHDPNDPQYALRPKSVLLTFDDGYEGNRYIKDDILKHTYNFGATFFIHTHFTGDNPNDAERHSDPWSKGHMSKEDLDNLEYDRNNEYKDGQLVDSEYSDRFQIESHTWSHPALDTLIGAKDNLQGKNGTTWDGLTTDLEMEMKIPLIGLKGMGLEGKHLLKHPEFNEDESLPYYLSEEYEWKNRSSTEKLATVEPHPNKPIEYLAYPFGRITPEHGPLRTEVMRAAANAGYKMAFIIDWPKADGKTFKLDNIYTVPRMEMTVDTWVQAGDPRAHEGKVPQFGDQIRKWKQTYEHVLLRKHETANINFAQEVAE